MIENEKLMMIILSLPSLDDIPIQDDNLNHTAAPQTIQALGSINEENENDPNTSKSQKSGKDGSKLHKGSFGGLKKLIDRDKDKDKDKDKDEKKEKEKEKERSTSVLKTGLSETKENVKKLIQGGKDKSNKSSTSSATAQATLQQPLQQTSLEYDNHQTSMNINNNNNNNGDMKNSPLLLLKRSNDINSESVAMDMTTLNDKSMPDIVNMSKIDSNGSSHGILSPFESIEDSDSEGIDPIEHQQLSSSSSASINMLMDNSNSKILGNVQVSQV